MFTENQTSLSRVPVIKKSSGYCSGCMFAVKYTLSRCTLALRFVRSIAGQWAADFTTLSAASDFTSSQVIPCISWSFHRIDLHVFLSHLFLLLPSVNCGASDLQIQKIWPRDAAAARPSLVANPGMNHISAGGFGIRLSEWTCTTVPCWWPSPGGGGRVTATTAALIVPATARSTIGDRAFSVVATRAWNSLPLSVTSSASLPIFRKHLKTVLFTRSFPS